MAALHGMAEQSSDGTGEARDPRISAFVAASPAGRPASKLLCCQSIAVGIFRNLDGCLGVSDLAALPESITIYLDTLWRFGETETYKWQ